MPPIFLGVPGRVFIQEMEWTKASRILPSSTDSAYSDQMTFFVSIAGQTVPIGWFFLSSWLLNMF